MDERVLLDLMICRVPGVRANERIVLQKKFDRIEDFSLLFLKDVENILGRPLKDRSREMPEIRALAEKDAALMARYGIYTVSWRDAAYPPLLREIFDPPALLFCRGVLPDPEKPLAALVGTRKPSSMAAARAYALGRELGEAGVPVVSGLALGIDTMAHRGNVEGKAPTVAVLGSSPERVYPASNRNLARRILETGGLLLSEYPPETGPFKWNFPARNRIISGLARGTVIVEAPEKSGALITAKFALEQGRDVWVDRAGVDSPRGAGTAFLASEGAVIISSAADILSEWNIKGFSREKPGEGTRGGAPSGKETGAGLAASLAEYLDIKV